MSGFYKKIGYKFYNIWCKPYDWSGFDFKIFNFD